MARGNAMTDRAGTLTHPDASGPRGRAQGIDDRRSAFSLLELLLVVAILSQLMQLLLPAVQSAREAARRSACSNQLRQLGIAALLHEGVHGHLPTGGWGLLWVGKADRGFGAEQPGGWAYNLLPYLGHQPLHDLPRGPVGPALDRATAEMCRTPVLLFYCPTRRTARLYPYGYRTPAPTRNCEPLVEAAKIDYAANAGDFFVRGPLGPTSEAEADASQYAWADVSQVTGIVYQRSQVRLADIADGASRTYLFGEKYMDAAHYDDGRDGGDNQTAWSGYDEDLNRWTADQDEPATPLQDHFGYADALIFGSAHPTGCYFGFCDGSVHFVAYTIDGDVHRRLGNRHDGQSIELPEAVLP